MNYEESNVGSKSEIDFKEFKELKSSFEIFNPIDNNVKIDDLLVTLYLRFNFEGLNYFLYLSSTL